MSRYKFDKFDTLSNIGFQTREIKTAFEDYKVHYDFYLSNLKNVEPKDKNSQFLLIEKVEMVEKAFEKMNSGNEDAEILSLANCFCKIMDGDKVRVQMQVQRLLKENRWFRSELHDLQKRLVKLENVVITAEAEKQHYQFVYKMRNLRRNEEQYFSTLIDSDDDDDPEPEEDVPSKIKPILNLCMEYIRDKRFEVALPLIEQHIRQIKDKIGENNNEIATLYSINAKIHKEQGNFAEAQKFYEKSLKIREKVLGKENNATGVTLSHLAQVMYKQGNFKDAEKFGVQALKIREKNLGTNNVDVAHIHSHLGIYYMHLEKWNDCINHYKMAMTVYKLMFEKTDNLFLKGYTNMVKAYVKLKQNDKAAETLGIICSLYQQRNGQEHPLTVFQTAQNSADGKGEDFKVEGLMKVYGCCENVIDNEVLQVMIEYFLALKKQTVVDVLKEWRESSSKQPTAIVKQSLVVKTSKRNSNLPETITSLKDKSSIIGMLNKKT